VDKLVADVELRYRSVNSAETDNSSLVIDDPELANSERNDLGSISGYHGLGRLCGHCALCDVDIGHAPTISCRRADSIGCVRGRRTLTFEWPIGAQIASADFVDSTAPPLIATVFLCCGGITLPDLQLL
jgi:hypothetical protein